jgi:hypothetical protein
MMATAVTKTYAQGMRKIGLYSKDGSLVAVTTVDATDYQWLSEFRWHLSAQGYAVTGGGNNKCSMHRMILGLGKGDKREVDHMNRNRLDNRQSNLRAVTKQENRQNLAGRGRSKYRGVYWSIKQKKWVAYINIGRKMHYLGASVDEHEAAAMSRASRLANFSGAID